MKTHLKYAFFWSLMTLLGMGISCKTQDVGNPREIRRFPRIEPEYVDTVIPPNIAPLNFVIQEKARRYRVEIAGAEGKSIEIHSRKPGVRIPLSRWKDLLARNKGKEIRFVVTVLDSQNQWVRFDPIRNRVAIEEIDGFLVYRLVQPLYILWKHIGIYQRDLRNFKEKPILTNGPLNEGCMNCHSFLHNSPDRWMIHLRRAPATNMLLNIEGKTVLVNTQTEFNKSPAVYPAWHPSGKFIAFSVNKVKQFFHMTGGNRDVYDLASDLILYNVDSNTVTTSPSIADPKRLETYPNWSPDGRQLYFCSAPVFDTSTVFRNNTYKNIRYDLMRIGFDPQTGLFGKLETVLAASKTGLSITHPRISPDGRFLLFCMSEYGNFPVYRSSSDLYLMDLQSDRYRRLEINSDRADSYHCWSSSGRWFVFSSKREDGIHARPYFSYVDERGNVYKPFVLPQRDPAFYESFLSTYNVPELITDPIPQRPQELIKIARRTDQSLKAKFVPSGK
jgi:hypothetical protein